MNNLDKQYIKLLRDIKDNGVRKEGRNGTTYSVFGRQIRHDMREGFPLLTTKKMWWRGIVTELIWFLSGNTNIQPLVKQGNNIWVGDSYKNFVSVVTQRVEDGELNVLNELGYLITHTDNVHEPISEKQFIEKIKTNDRFSKEFGELGPIYGSQWRYWGGEKEVHKIDTSGVKNPLHHRIILDAYLDDDYETAEKYGGKIISTNGIKGIDQIQNLLDTLRNNPDSRRMMVTAWNPSDLEYQILPPCHYGFQVWTRVLNDKERTQLFYSGEYTIGNRGIPAISNPNNSFLDDQHIPKRGISLMFNQRSVDTPLGLPFNIASYGLLLEMFGNEMNMLPLELIGNLGDTHIYENQLEGVEEQLQRKSHPLPRIKLEDGVYCTYADIYLENYVSEGKIKMPLSN